MQYPQSDLLLNKALQSIPLGSQTFSKSYQNFPKGNSPLFLTHGDGPYTWDVDGNRYVDFINGLLSILLGHKDKDVENAIIKQLGFGINFSLPHPIEMEVAETLIELIPCAQKVRFGKNGSDVTSAAVRLARAYTSKDRVAVCGYHGWHDWYIGTTTKDLGVPAAASELTHRFKYNDIDSLKDIFITYPNQIAAVILEPMNVEYPKEGFLEAIKAITHQHGAILIFDEIITGFRFNKGGAQAYFNVTPDLSVFGKGIANGMPLSVIVGKSEIMQLLEEVFFSATFGGETLSLAAAKAVLNKIKTEPVIETIYERGDFLQQALAVIINDLNMENIVVVKGHPAWSFIQFQDTPQYDKMMIQTYYVQSLLENGFLGFGSHNISYAHTTKNIEDLLNFYKKFLVNLKNHIKHSTLLENLKSPPLEPIFKVR